MLITRCPNCETTFRVRMEQLNLRGGRVRCGHCHVPFSALSSLEELPEETATTLISPAPAAQPTVMAPAPIDVPPPPPAIDPSDPIAPIDLPPTPPVLPRRHVEEGMHAAMPTSPSDAGSDLDFDIEDIEQAGAQAAVAVHENEAPQTVVEPSKATMEREPEERIEMGSADDDAAEFDREFERNLDASESEIDDVGIDDSDEMPQLHTIFLDEDIPPGAIVNEVATRAKTRRTLIMGNVLLLLTGVLLSAYVLRVELTRFYPGLRAPLEQACSYFACDVPYPRDADEVRLVDSDLTQADKSTNQGTYHLAVTVRNHARYPVAWPQMEITLTDRFERALTRRVLEPKEWLPANAAQSPAFEAQGEITSQIALSSDSQVVGYRLGVFYR
ncbi:MAG: family finger-like protein [Rhodocyclales bacterium]|nr:family finger-like protein [Rhodocyclales bacterium]